MKAESISREILAAQIDRLEELFTGHALFRAHFLSDKSQHL